MLGPVLGWLLDRFGPQGFIRIGVVVFGSGLMLPQPDRHAAAASTRAFLVIALGASLCGFFPLNVALIHWFERRRARALSSMSIGLALGGIIGAAGRAGRCRPSAGAPTAFASRHHRHRASACRSPW